MQPKPPEPIGARGLTSAERFAGRERRHVNTTGAAAVSASAQRSSFLMPPTWPALSCDPMALLADACLCWPRSRFAEIIFRELPCGLMDAKAVSGSAAGHFDDNDYPAN